MNFDQSRLVRSIKSLSFPNVTLQTSGPPNATTITGCQGAASGMESGALCGAYRYSGGVVAPMSGGSRCQGRNLSASGTCLNLSIGGCPSGYTGIVTTVTSSSASGAPTCEIIREGIGGQLGTSCRSGPITSTSTCYLSCAKN